MISVIIPTYNRQGMLADAVMSAASISGVTKEIIVIDDGSSDDTSQVAANLAQQFVSSEECLFRYERQERGGAPRARNRGIDCASGELIMFLDSDDVLNSDGIAGAIKTLEGSGCDIVHGRVQVTDEDLNFSSMDAVGGNVVNTEDFVFEYSWHTMGAVYRRAIFEGSGGWEESLTGSQDWELQARLKIDGWKRCFHEPDIFGYWRMHERARIGTNSFRHDYVCSVERACLLIAARAERKGMMTAKLASRIARRLFRHAIEFGIFGFPLDRDRVFSEILTTRGWSLGERVCYQAYRLFANGRIDRVVGKRFGLVSPGHGTNNR